MKKKVLHKRIPTIFALITVFIVLISIGITSSLIQRRVTLQGRANPSTAPQNITVSNITPSSFTVSFTTLEKTSASLSVTSDNLQPFIVTDIREQNAAGQQVFYSHYITVNNLDSQNNYEFSILSNGEIYLNKGNNYSVTTAPQNAENGTGKRIAKGQILLAEGEPADDTIVTLQTQDSQVVSALTSQDGSFQIQIDNLRSTDLLNLIDIREDSEITINAVRRNQTVVLKFLAKNADPIPPITLTNTYDFTVSSDTEIATASSQLSVAPETPTSREIKIVVPKASQSFIDTRPRFSGTAFPNQEIKVKIDSNNPSVIKAGNNGAWTFRPAQPLIPGQHTINISGQDNFGITRNVSASFSIFPSGAQLESDSPLLSPPPAASPTTNPTATTVPTQTPRPTSLPSSTPTANPTPSTVITQNPTQIPTQSPTSAPTNAPTITVNPSPTAIPTALPTNTPTVFQQITATPYVTIPAVGNGVTITLTAISFMLIAAGSILILML